METPSLTQIEVGAVLVGVGVLAYLAYRAYGPAVAAARAAAAYVAKDGMPIDDGGNLTDSSGNIAPDQPGAAFFRSVLDTLGISYPKGAQGNN